MTLAHRSQHLDRAGFLAASGVLLVLREAPPAPPPSPGQPPAVSANPAEGPEILLALWEDGSATGLHGHVDLGTGLRTALSQLVAEELDLPLAQVTMVMGHTCSVPNQGATIASASIQVHGLPLRQAAAQARAWLREQGATPDDLQGRQVRLLLDPAAATLKPHEQHRVIGQPVPRVDIPAKATGELIFVHDMRLPGMLHGRVVRPPYAGVDAGDFVGRTLQSVDRDSIGHLHGIVDLVVIGDFIGIVAEREDQAEAAMQALQVQWKPWPGLQALHDVENAVRSNPATRRLLLEKGDVRTAIAGAAQPMPRSYLWPYQLHASIGPSCAVADWQDGKLTVWAGTQNPHVLRADLARLTGLADVQVDVVRMEAAGCYGRNGADDVAADAALLSRAVGQPVRVQLTREQEHAWEPKGAAQLMQIDGGLQADGSPAAYDFQTSYPSNGAPTLALLLTGTVPATATAYEMGDRTAVPPYDYANLRVAANDMAPILRASWLRGVSALPNSFAHESYIDELATAAGVDPVDYRLRWLKDERAAELVRATAAKAGWRPHTAPQGQPAVGDVLRGQGFAYARYVHSKFPGFGAAWAAWVADVEVNRVTGEVHVSRVVVGHDAGLMVNPAGVQHQVHGNVLQTTSRALKEQVRTEPSGPNIGAVATREWGSYPILSFREVPVVEVMLMPRPGEAPLGSGESASVPGTAAIANAIFDATGVRFRNPPFTPEVVRAALNPLPGPQEDAGAAAALPPAAEAPALPRPALPPDAPLPRRRRGLWATAGALLAGLVGLGAAAFGWRPAIAPVAAGSSALVYTSQTIERGRLLAAAGDCVVCHTAPGGAPNAGGRAMHTPFGTVYSTNLTPDAATGIGQWSFSAFQRAMREGISRDGRHLYPAFPYTSFTRMTDDDLTALYAYLMAQPAVAHQPPATKLAFPFNLRPLMAMWNALYLVPGPMQPEPARSAEWNRGAYLVNGPGHCGACHTPRNAFGAERIGSATLSGAMVDGWEAPALTALSTAPLPWTADDFYSYLRHGYSPRHGVAGGPMAPVVQQLQALPDADIRAMAVYLASFNKAQATPPAAAAALAVPLPDARARLFEGACGACHHDTPVPGQFGLDLPLALNSNLHSARPDNLLRTILDGLQHPPTRDVGYMPAFRHALDDRQIADIAAYLRQRHAPDKPAWPDLASDVARLRQQPAH
ncbi:molybdopterin cofactor-binding domain-containing protein [Aquincola sp. J276]|uniref:molybdopterin cofactor-binding domain-containing protein n=1 Tax=Aquincola sp. J276 TaxID=2898432 RepID=UPI0021511199|nr:molybdopterin cofactor-binding domain-containing protein [Aquincola sp. J276]MCR5865735.1 molybdopterin-dependent oxidoreductase [Aquincola sp. J276]